MTTSPSSRSHLFHGVFRLHQTATGQSQLTACGEGPTSIPDPHGRLLKIATVDTSAPGICPACAATARGGYLSFVQDLRLAYACPSCEQLVWLNGA